MNDIDRYLDQACRQVNGPDSLRAHLRKELKEHLEEAIDALVAEGMSTDDATAKAIEDLGDPEIVRDGMESVYGPGVTSLLVDKAIKWRDQKWHIAAQVGLALIVAIAIGCTMFMLYFVMPKLGHIHFVTGIESPAFLATTISFSSIVWNHYWIGLLVLIGGWGLFEWKCRSENKAAHRTVAGVCLSLLSVLVGFWIMAVTAVSFAILTPTILGDKSIDIQEPIAQWNILGPISPNLDSKEVEAQMVATYGQTGSTSVTPDLVKNKPVRWTTEDSLDRLLDHAEAGSAYAWCDIDSETEETFTFAASCDDFVKVWLNGLLVHEDNTRGANGSRFSAKLNAGTNRFLVQTTNIGGPWDFAIQQLGTSSSSYEDKP